MKKVVGLGGEVVAGAVIGSFIGIAGFGTAVAGTVPVAIVGGVVGWLAADRRHSG